MRMVVKVLINKYVNRSNLRIVIKSHNLKRIQRLKKNQFTISKVNHFTTSAFYQFIISAAYHFTTSAFYEFTISEVYHFTTSEFYQFNMSAVYHFSILPILHFCSLPLYHFCSFPFHHFCIYQSTEAEVGTQHFIPIHPPTNRVTAAPIVSPLHPRI